MLRKIVGQTRASSNAKDKEEKSERKSNLAFWGQTPLRDSNLSGRKISLMAEFVPEERENSRNTQIFQRDRILRSENRKQASASNPPVGKPQETQENRNQASASREELQRKKASASETSARTGSRTHSLRQEKTISIRC